jgi:kumamolisin
MNHRKFPVLLFLILALCAAGAAQTDPTGINRNAGKHIAGGQIVTPASGIERPGDLGLRSHTNFKIFIPPGRPSALVGFSSPKAQPAAGYNGETPASLACIYGLTTWTAGCNPAKLANSLYSNGGSKAIAIVDAYDYPTAATDLQAYSTQFGLPAIVTSGTGINFTVAYQVSGHKPATDVNCASSGWNCWAAEAALDIEMAHAMAPKAHIYLVEANSTLNSDLYAAVKVAAGLVAAAGGGEVSMSWGGSEYSTETTSDSTFSVAKVVFFASAGDREGTEYPSVSPDVVAVGGTTLSRNPSTGNIEGEGAWEDTGGGYSVYEPLPSFQSSLSGIAGGKRAVPDIAAVANPRTPVWVYDSYATAFTGIGTNGYWNLFGGTSVAAPLWAGIANRAGHFATSSNAEEVLLYQNDPLSPYLRDVTYGTCGYYDGWMAIEGWDPCTGLGSPYGLSSK